METTQLGQASRVNIASKSHCWYTRINLKLTACNGRNLIQPHKLEPFKFCVTDIPCLSMEESVAFLCRTGQNIRICLHRHVTLCITALKMKSHFFGSIIGPTMAILGLFERDSHVEFIYHIFGTSVKTPLCYFHRSLTLPFSDMCCHHLACALSRAPVNR